MKNKKVAIVTGGGRGIGKGISLGLGEDGIGVAVVYHSRPEDAQNVVAELVANGVKAHFYKADVAIKAQVQEMVQKVIDDFGRVDILVNNAGIATQSKTVDLSEEDWNLVMDANVKGTFFCCQETIPIMQAQKKGRIVNFSSIAGQTGGAIGPHYAAAKAGLIGLTRFMARELGPDGITVNAIAPSGIPTDLLSDMGFNPNPNRPVGRVGNLDDCAAAVRYFVSDAASYVTGQLLAVNGGVFMG